MRLSILLLLLPSLALAQTPSPTPPNARVSSPGALLDDYDVNTPGTLAVTWGVNYGRVRAGDDRAFPSMDATLGITRRFDLSASTSLTKSRFEDFRTIATGDAYVSARLVVLTEGKHRPGVTFEPVLEVLGRPSLANNLLAPDKVNGVLGVITGKSFDHFRVYNHSGYFTRGIFFTSAAVEFTSLFKRVTPAVWANFGVLTDRRDVAASIQNNVSQPNVGGTLGFRISQNWSGFVSGGHGFGRRDPNTSDYQLGAGISYTFKLWEPK